MPKRPWTVNTARNWHHHKLAKHVKEWREAFKDLAEEAGIPPLHAMRIEVVPILADNRTQDTAACALAAKAAIDGVVDAGVVPDDNRTYMKYVKFYPPVVIRGHNSMIVRVIEVLPYEEEDFDWCPDIS